MEETGVRDAPTRRPKNYPDQRRPSEGHRPVSGSIRARAASAVAKLKTYGDHDEAAAIQSLLGPRGYLLLRRTEEGETSPLSLTVSDTLKRALLAAAEEFDVVLDAPAEQAYQRVLAGEWVPEQATWGSKGGTKAVLQVSLDAGLRQEVQAQLSEISDAVGYKVLESNIVLSYLCEELGVEPDAGPRKPGRFASRYPAPLVAHWARAAEAAGTSLDQVVEDGARAVLDGSVAPKLNRYMADANARVRVPDPDRPGQTIWAPSPAGRWSDASREWLGVHIDPDLLPGLALKAKELSEQNGFQVYPGSIVRAILTERLGQPE
jgi:hypothetical protein